MSPVEVAELASPRPPTAAGPRRDYSFASASVVAHLVRGLAGFGPLVLAWILWPRAGWIAALPAVVGVVALRGCPMCWTIGLVQTVSRQRYRRVCDGEVCTLVAASPREPTRGAGTVSQ